MTYTTAIHNLPAPDQLPPDIGPDVPKDVKDLADAIDQKLTPFSHGSGPPGAPGKAGQRYRDDVTGIVYLDIGPAWVQETPPSNSPAATPSLRKLGTGATDAAAGDDSRLSDQRTPSNNSVTAAKVHTSLKPSTGAAAATEALRALGAAPGTAAAGNDARLGDQRVPLDNSVTTSKIATNNVTWDKIAGIIFFVGFYSIVGTDSGPLFDGIEMPLDVIASDDTSGIADPGGVTIPRTGIYLVESSVEFKNAPGDEAIEYRGYVKVEPQVFERPDFIVADDLRPRFDNTSGFSVVTLAAETTRLRQGDFLALQAKVAGSANVRVTGGAPYMKVTWLGK